MADAAALSLQFLRIGGRPEPVERPQRRDGGRAQGRPRADGLDRKALVPRDDLRPDRRVALRALCGEADDRRRPRRLRAVRPPPATPGAVRQLVVLPTNTWQAYNMYDRDGDGWGDTWYAGGNPPVDLTRPYRDRGVPPRFRPTTAPSSAGSHGRAGCPDMVAEDDLEVVASGDDLRALYDLVVFSGHSEYMTGHSYDVVERFRDLGGRLIFLSADNFFWRVDKVGDTMRKIKPFREEGRPEARIAGVQYRANDDGSARAPTPSSTRRQHPGSSTRRASRRAPPSARPSAATGSRSTRQRRTRRRGPSCSRGSTDLFGPGPQRGDDVLRDRGRRAGLLRGLARLRRLGEHVADHRMLENLWQHMLEPPPRRRRPPPPAPPRPHPDPSPAGLRERGTLQVASAP